jgi:nucleotide-binding universal stress UspA family protein
MANILVPVDGSRNAMRAIDYAIRLANGGPLELHLLTVAPPLDDYGMVAAYLSRQQHTREMKVRGASVLQGATARARAPKVKTTTHLVIGDVPDSIVRTARRLHCDAIVMGTRGMGLLKDLLLGSVASKVLHLTRIPVTLVK